MEIDQNTKKWLEGGGEKFLRGVGLKTGHKVLDFGCGKGNYTIPTAMVVGKRGKIYAIDKYAEPLKELTRRANAYGLKNIKKIKTSGKVKIPLQDKCIDIALLYDVLHPFYFKKAADRKKLLNEVHRILRPDALLSVYPKHFESGVKDIIKEVREADFSFKRKFNGILIHNDKLIRGYIFNFRKVP